MFSYRDGLAGKAISFFMGDKMAAPEAVIEIGATGVRLLVAEVTEDRKRNILDRAEMPYSLGREVFTTGSITRETQLQCLHILQRFKEQLSGWGIEPGQANVIATAAFREAKNKDPVMDKIFSQTGFRVKVIDGIEENRLMYLAVTECFQGDAPDIKSGNSVILEVSGGSTELMLMKKGKIAGAHSLHIGTVRLAPKIKGQSINLEDIQRYVEEYAINAKGLFESELNISEVNQFIAVGGDATLAAINAGQPISTWLWSIEREKFDSFVDEIQQYTTDECVARFKISYNDAQTLPVSLLIYKMFIHHTNVQTIIVPETNIRNGLVYSKTAAPSEELKKEFSEQIIASATNLLRKYHGDIFHAKNVMQNSLKIYECMEKELSLDERSRTLLAVSALLHDIGNFINMSNHHEHSEYIIRHSDIFGLTRPENIIVATIAHYHRGKQRPEDSEQFQILARSDRMQILKLTAILRIADALDRSHGQSIRDFYVKLKNDSLIISAKGIKNLALERIALAEKGELFESVFGYKVILV